MAHRDRCEEAHRVMWGCTQVPPPPPVESTTPVQGFPVPIHPAPPLWQERRSTRASLAAGYMAAAGGTVAASSVAASDSVNSQESESDRGTPNASYNCSGCDTNTDREFSKELEYSKELELEADREYSKELELIQTEASKEEKEAAPSEAEGIEESRPEVEVREGMAGRLRSRARVRSCVVETSEVVKRKAEDEEKVERKRRRSAAGRGAEVSGGLVGWRERKRGRKYGRQEVGRREGCK